MPTMTITTGDAQMVDTDPHDAFRLGEHRIRLDFSYFESATAPNVPSALFEIFTVWKHNLSDVVWLRYRLGRLAESNDLQRPF
jgi:hypothetical protein